MHGEGFAYFRWYPHRKRWYGEFYNGRSMVRCEMPAFSVWRHLQEWSPQSSYYHCTPYPPSAQDKWSPDNSAASTSTVHTDQL
jgi:hypothetical protein